MTDNLLRLVDRHRPRMRTLNMIQAAVRDGERINYLSVCSGIEAATVAWEPLGRRWVRGRFGSRAEVIRWRVEWDRKE